MWKIAKRLQVGEMTINDLPRHGVGYFPFGCVKYSVVEGKVLVIASKR